MLGYEKYYISRQLRPSLGPHDQVRKKYAQLQNRVFGRHIQYSNVFRFQMYLSHENTEKYDFVCAKYDVDMKRAMDKAAKRKTQVGSMFGTVQVIGEKSSGTHVIVDATACTSTRSQAPGSS